MQKCICNRCVEKGIPRWLPVPIDSIRQFLLDSNPKFKNDEQYYTLASNIAYEMQYLEFLYYELSNIKITESLRKQLIKTFVITSSNIIEGILYYSLEPQLNRARITYSVLINEAIRIDILKAHKGFYDKLRNLKDLRNKAHIQLSVNTTESDYNSFNNTALNTTKSVLSGFIKRFYKIEDEKFIEIFYYLNF